MSYNKVRKIKDLLKKNRPDGFDLLKTVSNEHNDICGFIEDQIESRDIRILFSIEGGCLKTHTVHKDLNYLGPLYTSFKKDVSDNSFSNVSNHKSVLKIDDNNLIEGNYYISKLARKWFKEDRVKRISSSSKTVMMGWNKLNGYKDGELKELIAIFTVDTVSRFRIDEETGITYNIPTLNSLTIYDPNHDHYCNVLIKGITPDAISYQDNINNEFFGGISDLGIEAISPKNRSYRRELKGYNEKEIDLILSIDIANLALNKKVLFQETYRSYNFPKYPFQVAKAIINNINLEDHPDKDVENILNELINLTTFKNEITIHKSEHHPLAHIMNRDPRVLIEDLGGNTFLMTIFEWTHEFEIMNETFRLYICDDDIINVRFNYGYPKAEFCQFKNRDDILEFIKHLELSLICNTDEFAKLFYGEGMHQFIISGYNSLCEGLNDFDRGITKRKTLMDPYYIHLFNLFGAKKTYLEILDKNNYNQEKNVNYGKLSDTSNYKSLEVIGMNSRQIESVKESKDRLGFNLINYGLIICIKKVIVKLNLLSTDSDVDPRVTFVDIRSVDDNTFDKVLEISSVLLSRGFSSESKVFELASLQPLDTLLTSVRNIVRIIDSKNSMFDIINYNGFSQENDEISYIQDTIDLMSKTEMSRVKFKFDNIADIMRMHDDLLYKYEIKKDEIISRQFRDKVNKNKYMECSDEYYSMISPKSISEIEAEGKSLRHCILVYVNRIIEGQSNIFFIRKTGEEDKSLYTLELNRNMEIVQFRGLQNSKASPDAYEFVNKRLKHIIKKDTI